MTSESKSTALYRDLDTSFINLWGLLRKLTQEKFIGRVRVELKDYTADVFMNGSSTPLVREVDREAGTETIEEAALHRLVLRSRESPGRVSVFAGADEVLANPVPPASKSDFSAPRLEQASTSAFQIPPPLMNEPTIPEWQLAPPMAAERGGSDHAHQISPVNEKLQWADVVTVSGEVIGAVERAIKSMGADFAGLFRNARTELADDYPFFDPTSSEFQYADSAVTMRHAVSVDTYVAGVSELLRRTVNRVASGDRARRIRERVALELALAARNRSEALSRSGFREHFNRIAGTEVM